MEKVLVYPYNKLYQSYVWTGEIDENKRIHSLVSPNGWGLEGKEVKYDKGKYVINSNFSSELKKCSTVWFVEDDIHLLPETVLLSKVIEAIKNKKNIIYTRYKDKLMYDKVMNLIPNLIKHSICCSRKTTNENVNNFCYSIKVPVVAILGIEENVQKFDVQVALWRKFRELDYNVEAISTRLDSEIIGINSIPKFMLETGMSDTDKIIQYNHYVKQIEITKKPDLIIIGVPGSVLPFDKANHNNFGTMAFLISMAVPVDYAILCSPFYKNTDFDFTELKRDIFYKFGFEVVFCHIAPVALDLRSIYEDYIRRFFTIKEEYIQTELDKFEKTDVGFLLDPSNLDKVSSLILDVLS